MTTKRPTIHDVAELAGVSKSLVSLVFKQDTGVSEERRERVLKAAQELGYTPNMWARSMRANDNSFVAIIVSDFHNPLLTEIADLTRHLLAKKGIFSFIAIASTLEKSGSTVLDAEPIQHLLDLKPSSIFIVGGLPEQAPADLLTNNLPVVVACASATNLPRAVTVRSDDDEAMRLICDHLASTGHSNLAFIGPAGRSVDINRRKAFERQIKLANLQGQVISTGLGLDESSGKQAAQRLLEQELGVTAIVAFNDNIAFGVQEALDAARLKTPMAVTGYDNTYIGNLGRVGLTSIDQDEEQIATQVVELLTNPDLYEKGTGEEILITPRLVIRDSSQPQLNRNL